MDNLEYMLCSKSVIDAFPSCTKSRPFKSGYNHNEGDVYFVALLDTLAVERHYNEVNNDDDFWTRVCGENCIDVSKITINSAKKNGLFLEIEMKTGLSTERNIALAIHGIAAKYGINPIELINKIA